MFLCQLFFPFGFMTQRASFAFFELSVLLAYSLACYRSSILVLITESTLVGSALLFYFSRLSLSCVSSLPPLLFLFCLCLSSLSSFLCYSICFPPVCFSPVCFSPVCSLLSAPTPCLGPFLCPVTSLPFLLSVENEFWRLLRVEET